MTRPKMFALFVLMSLAPSLVIALFFHQEFQTEKSRALIVPYFFLPIVGTLLLQAKILHQPILDPLAIRFRTKRWWLVAWTLPAISFFSAVLFAELGGLDLVWTGQELLEKKRALFNHGIVPDEEKVVEELGKPPSPLKLVVLAMPAGITVNALLGFCMELPFRGFLFREIRGSFWKRVILMGTTDFLFAIPLLLFGAFHNGPKTASLISFAAFILVITPTLTYLRAHSGSILPGAIFRGTVLALTPVGADMFFGISSTLAPMMGLFGSAGLSIAFLFCVLHESLFADEKLIFQRKHAPELPQT